LSTAIGQLTALTDLRLNDIFIGGPIPDSVFALSNLRILTAGGTLLSEEIPNVFVGFAALEDFDLSGNLHTGPIPDSIFDSPALKRVYLNNNGLTGSIPINYSNPPNLEDLFLSSNSLIGTVPEIDPGDLLQLDEFLIQENDLTGSMPQSICDLRTAGALTNLFADCGGPDPQIECEFDVCCTLCV
jgi:Leucine-rich repeat (LRR) protein